MAPRAKRLVLLALLLLPSLLAAQYRVIEITRAEDLPEVFFKDWQKGDLIVTDGSSLLLIGGQGRAPRYDNNSSAPFAAGNILGFVPAGQGLVSRLNAGGPVVRFDGRPEYLVYTTVSPIPTSSPDEFVLECSLDYRGRAGRSARIRTFYRWSKKKAGLDVRSSVTNTGPEDFTEFAYSLNFYADAPYSFSPFSKDRLPQLNFRIYKKKDHALAWLNLNPLASSEGPVPGTLGPGRTFELHYVLMTAAEDGPLLEQVYRSLHVPAHPAEVTFKNASGTTREIIVRDLFSAAVFYKSFLGDVASARMVLPAGVYEVQANFFPAVVSEHLSVEDKAANSCTLADLPLGTLKVKISDGHGRSVPGKVTVLGLSPTRTPYFLPENPLATGRDWEGFKNSVYPPEPGLSFKIPAGTYLVLASRGPEYSRQERVVEVFKDDTQELGFGIERVIHTPGLVALDSHLHTQNSDGEVLVPERLRSLAAEGVEAAVATDHNFVTDYGSALRALGLDKDLAVTTGVEVTSGAAGIHYNTYPVARREEEEHKGAIPFHAASATELLQLSRAMHPAALLQLNHPRAGNLGYFNNGRLDRESAAFAVEGFDLAVDLIEVLNGPFPHPSNAAAVEDWLHLMNKGHYRPLVGNSDSHGIDRDEPGSGRTYVLHEGAGGPALDWTGLFEALKAGRSFASNGPLLECRVNGSHSFGQTVAAVSGRTDIHVRVLAAAWVDTAEVRIILNGVRKVVFPLKSGTETVVRFDERLSLNLKQDTALVVEVTGRRSLFPVLQETASAGEVNQAALPYAIANPIFIDVDGNGRFDPPWPAEIEKRQNFAGTSEVVPRR